MEANVDIVILDAGTWEVGGGGTYMISETLSLFIKPTFISATIGLGFTSAVMRKVIGASDLTGASFITGTDFFSRF